jgi:hypothetical protein
MVSLSLSLSSDLPFSCYLIFSDIGGIQEINRLCKRAVSRRVLAVASTILVTLIPSPEEIKRLHEDFSTIPVEAHNVLAALKRTQLFAFGHLPKSVTYPPLPPQLTLAPLSLPKSS